MNRESGATMTEYVLMVALIAIALVAVIILFQGALSDSMEETADCVGSIASGGAGDCPGVGDGDTQ